MERQQVTVNERYPQSNKQNEVEEGDYFESAPIVNPKNKAVILTKPEDIKKSLPGHLMEKRDFTPLVKRKTPDVVQELHEACQEISDNEASSINQSLLDK